MAIKSGAYRMANRLAGGNLDAILRRACENGETLDAISQRLYAEHGIEVTKQTIANWVKPIKEQVA